MTLVVGTGETQNLGSRQDPNMGYISIRWGGGGISSVQLLGRVRLIATPWTAACQASLSITNSRYGDPK